MDVPAAEDPEFSRAVKEMVEASKSPSADQIIAAVHDTQEEAEDAPPQQALPEEGKAVEGMREMNPNVDKDELEAYVRKGLSNQDIARQMDISKQMVAYYVKKYGLDGIRKRGGRRKVPADPLEQHEPEEMSPGWNTDRHACKTCVYGPSEADRNSGIGCNYCELVGRSRKCDPADCDKYIRGKRMEREDLWQN